MVFKDVTSATPINLIVLLALFDDSPFCASSLLIKNYFFKEIVFLTREQSSHFILLPNFWLFQKSHSFGCPLMGYLLTSSTLCSFQGS